MSNYSGIQVSILLSVLIHMLIVFGFMGINKSCVAWEVALLAEAAPTDKIIMVDLMAAPLAQKSPNPEREKTTPLSLPQKSAPLAKVIEKESESLTERKECVPEPVALSEENPAAANHEANLIVEPAVAVSEPEKGLESGVGGRGVENGKWKVESVGERGVEKQQDISSSRLLTYQKKVRGKIEQMKLYPLMARRNGIEGQVIVQFTILSNGSVTTIENINSSGNKILDKAAMNAVKRASPFPHIPEDIAEKGLQMRINIAFRLTAQ
ncbi:energy transducer TonB [bacterium]|nr:energy transducer TonB [bacterium]